MGLSPWPNTFIYDGTFSLYRVFAMGSRCSAAMAAMVGISVKVAAGTRSILPTQPAPSTTGELTFGPSSSLDAALCVPQVPPKVSHCIERPRRRVLLPFPPFLRQKLKL